LCAGAIVHRGKITGRQGAFRWILARPFGPALLIVMAIGLFGYAVWRVSSAIFDSDHRGRDAKGILIRAGSLIRGIFYAWIAIELFLGGGKGSDTQARHWTARAMDKPLGRWAVAIAGA